MVWLNAADDNGNGLYLNIHRVEQREELFALHATVGDGYYEGEILVEVGPAVVVTFADAWLNPGALDDFFFRAERSKVEEALRDKASAMIFCIDNFPSLENRPRREVVAFQSEGACYPMRPLREEQLELPMIGEEGVSWRISGAATV